MSCRGCSYIVTIILVAVALWSVSAAAAGGSRRLLQTSPGSTFPGIPGLTVQPSFPIPFPPFFVPSTPGGSGSGTPSFPSLPHFPGTPSSTLPNAPAAPIFTPPRTP
ncbi:hypothetical protein C2S53_006518 [Perilla frutescens var. hirtella]|uniref:Uncharacterized protein n=1 Tax=Perilla frutescens var. hirtella TaxID=608512 RepID=A0AAD4IYT0_PERFH|nr:hypothetical protein C2S53_006518 [Perilla frutescens var. hirtella]